MTTFFTTVKDWQWGRFAPQDFGKMRTFYNSAVEQGINVTVLYDELPQSILDYETASFKFHRVNLNEYDSHLGVNDVRFCIARDLVGRNPEWRSIFLTDLFDVKVGMNPCGQTADNKLYIGNEPSMLKGNGWMKGRYQDMGGKYLQWFDNSVSE